MELTFNLPPLHWYRPTPDNDPTYWPIDYPPLSAYVSYFFAHLLHFIEPSSMHLHTSRGYETSATRATMRLTVLLSDVLILFPAILFLSSQLYNPRSSHPISTRLEYPLIAVTSFSVSLPALVLIDHGHFQYNGVSLGLFLFAVSFFLSDRDAIGAVFFCASIYFKHMGLYYALAIFSFLATRAVRRLLASVRAGLIFVGKVMAMIAITTVVSFWPWIQSPDDMRQVIRRLFPLGRGLYEDKVANLWCSISVAIKLQKLLPQDALFRFCAAITVVASLPFCMALMWKPTRERLVIACSGCALAAYLFSYQVHEKQVLLPLLPLSLLYATYPWLCVWASYVAMGSMFPLLYREGLGLAYIATALAHLAVILQSGAGKKQQSISCSVWWRLAAFGSLLVGVLLHVLLIVGTPPPRAPHMFILLNTMYACSHLCAVYICLLVLVWAPDADCGTITAHVQHVLRSNFRSHSKTS